MMQLVPKWKVVVTFMAGGTQTFWISDHALGNVLRVVANMQFSENGLIQPLAITVSGITENNSQSGSHVSTASL